MSQPIPYPLESGTGTQPGTFACPIVSQGQNPIIFGGTRYTLAQQIYTPSTNTTVVYGRLSVYSSTNTGSTWTAQDVAHAPNPAFDFGNFGAGISYSTGSIIRVAYFTTTTTSPIVLNSFTMGTNTWGTAITGGPNGGPSTSFLGLIELGSGTQMVLYNTKPSFFNSFFALYDGTNWGSATQIDIGGSHTRLRNMAFDPASKTTYFIVDQFNSGSNTFYGSINSGGTLSSLSDLGGFTDRDIAWGAGLVNATNTSVYFPVVSTSTWAGVVVATPLIGSPAFTTQTIVTTLADTRIPALIQLPTGAVQAYWGYGTDTDTTQIWYSQQAVGGTSWGTNSLWWEWNTTPPVPTMPYDQFMNGNITISLFTSSSVAIEWSGPRYTFVGTEWALQGVQQSEVFYQEAPVPVGTVALFPSCPTTNTMFIGTSYNGTLNVSGGNGTYAFTVLS